MKTVHPTHRVRWAHSARLLNVTKTENKAISPKLIEANREARKRLSDTPAKAQVMAW